MDYRLYFMDADGHIKDVVEMVCEDEDEAVQQAVERRDGRAMELWKLDVRVTTFAAAAPQVYRASAGKAGVNRPDSGTDGKDQGR